MCINEICFKDRQSRLPLPRYVSTVVWRHPANRYGTKALDGDAEVDHALHPQAQAAAQQAAVVTPERTGSAASKRIQTGSNAFR